MDDIRQRTSHKSRGTFWSALAIGFIVWLSVALGYGVQSWQAIAGQTWLRLDATSAVAESVTQQNLAQYSRGFDFLDQHLNADNPSFDQAAPRVINPETIFPLLRQPRAPE